MAFGQVSIDDVYKAREFVRSMGSLEKAMAALVALGQFGGEGDKASGQGEAPFVSDCRWPEREKASNEST